MSAHPHRASRAAGSPPIGLVPMVERDLAEVAVAEARNYEFPWTRGNFADSLAAGHGAWIWREGGTLVGYAVTMLVLDEAHLLNITIDRDWRGAGRGRRMLGELCDRLAEAGATRLILEVRPSNEAAISLYLSDGFTRVGVRRGYYPARDGREDAVVMVRPL